MEAAHINILLLEDDPGDAALIRHMLGGVRGIPVHLERAQRLADGLELLHGNNFDLILLDLSLPDSSGIDTVARMHARAPDMPIIVLTGHDDEAIGASAIWAGAQDYLVKGQVNGPLLIRSIRYAISRQRCQTAIRQQSLVDEATGLYNRHAFLTLAQRDLKLARRRNERVVLVLIRRGGLGRVAATLGHEHGQRIFADFAQILRAAFRETDLIARVGPDEFAILALDVSAEGAEVLASSVQKSLPMLTSHQDWLSFRVAAVTQEAGVDISARELLAKADAACHVTQPANA
ncbi:MAG TPA: diguanylate cyclase [Planctomycetota bacterium]|nr:diguanylate cyclase [Planctomycetota bacterium]